MLANTPSNIKIFNTTIVSDNVDNLPDNDNSVASIAHAIEKEEIPTLLHKANMSEEIFHDSQTWKDDLSAEEEETFYDTTEAPKPNPVDELLEDLTYQQLTGHNEQFSTLICALQTIEQLQNLEAI